MSNITKEETNQGSQSDQPSLSADCPHGDLIDSVILGEKLGFGFVAVGLSALNFGLLPTAFVACGAMLVGYGAKKLGRRLECRKKHSKQIIPSPN
jgi:hypothetical protein